MKLLRHLIRLTVISALLAGVAAVIAVQSPAAWAAPLSAQDGWVRIAHLSPEAPAMDMYLYPFGNSADPTVLRDVAYGDASAYMKLSPGEYTVAMRGFDAPATSHPALVTSFMVDASTAYTVAALGPDPGLRVDVLKDLVTAPRGKTLVRVVQASLKQGHVTVTYGSTLLAKQFAFNSVTPYATISPSSRMLELTASGETTSASLGLTADTVHTIVVLDGPSGLKADDLTDAVGALVMPTGGAATGFGGTAPRSPEDLVPWLLVVLAGSVLTAVGVVGLGRRPRRTAAIH